MADMKAQTPFHVIYVLACMHAFMLLRDVACNRYSLTDVICQCFAIYILRHLNRLLCSAQNKSDLVSGAGRAGYVI